MKRLLAAVIAALAVGVVAVAVASSPLGSSGGPNKMSYIVVPHPDDETQAWSLIEDSTGNYKVFIMLTRGEQSYYCGSPGYDEGTGEAAPDPWPEGKWTPTCEQARMNSFFDFMAAMALTDDALPASFTYGGVKGPFDALGTEVCRYDVGDCVADLGAEVWTSPIAAVVWFNLGDGDVTTEEVEWAVTTVRDNRAELGINDSLRNHNLIGASYWNGGPDGGPGGGADGGSDDGPDGGANGSYPDCSDYAHPDHGAVHKALWQTDFEVGYQAVATCATDPDVTRREEVSLAHFDDAFKTSGAMPLGAHPVHYGWLLDGNPGYYQGDYDGQATDFHRHQTFWVRFK